MCTKTISRVDPPRPATDHETPPPPTQRDAHGLAPLGRLADIGIVDKLLPPQSPMNGGYMPLYIISKTRYYVWFFTALDYICISIKGQGFR